MKAQEERTASLPQTRLQLRRLRWLRLLLAMVVATPVGGLTYYVLHYSFGPEPKWVVNFPPDEGTQWKTFNTQNPLERIPPSIAKHHMRWFVVPRDPDGESTSETEWYFIDGEKQRTIGPWKPDAGFAHHGFHPNGCYVGVEHALPDEDVLRVHIFDPVKARGRVESIPRPRTSRRDYEQVQLSADSSTIAVWGVALDKPLVVRVYDACSATKRRELTFPERTGHPLGVAVAWYTSDESESVEELADEILCSLSATGKFIAVGSTSTGIDFVELGTGKVRFSVNQIPGKDGPVLMGQEGHLHSVEFEPSDRFARITIYIPRQGVGITSRGFHAAVVDLTSGALTHTPVRGADLFDPLFGARRPPVVYSPDGTTSLRPGRGWDQPLFPVARLRPLSRLNSSGPHAEPNWADAESASLDANGYLIHACPVPDSDFVVANVIRTIPGRGSVLPFGRSVLNYLNLDDYRPETYEEHILQMGFVTQRTTPIRMLKTRSPYSQTDVLVQPNRVGLLLQKPDHQVFEIWPLPRYDVPWIRPCAIALALVTAIAVWLNGGRAKNNKPPHAVG